MHYLGIDGCKAGWLMVYTHQEKYAYAILSQFSALTTIIPSTARIWVDMPIGLSAEGCIRTVEQRLRQELGNRSTTVFNVPVRAAVYANSKAAARAENIRLTGKSLSEQSLNITSKIKEVDRFVSGEELAAMTLYESHPELCFKYLSGGIVQSKKSTSEGIAERLSILEGHDSSLVAVYDSILKNTQRKAVKRDDIVDALGLCLANRLAGVDGMQMLQKPPLVDALGIGMGVAYYDPER